MTGTVLEGASGSRSTSLKVGVLWTLAGNVVYSGAQWAQLVLIARLTNVTSVGTFALGLAIGAPVYMFANLRLRFAQASDAKDEHSFNTYWRVRVVTSLAALAGLMLFGLFWPTDATSRSVVIALAVAKGIESVSDLCYGQLQKLDLMALIARSMILKGALSTIGVYAALRWTASVATACWVLSATWGLGLLVYDLPVTIRTVRLREGVASVLTILRFRGEWAEPLALARACLPLGVVALLASLSQTIPRYVVNGALGREELGFYTAVNYLLTAGVLVYAAFAQTALPRLSRAHAVGDFAAFSRLLRICLMSALAGGVAGVVVAEVAGSYALGKLYGPGYAHYAPVLLLMMVAAGLNYVALILWYALTAQRAFRIQLPLFLGDVAIIFTVSRLLVPRLGVAGAAWAIIATMTYHVVVCGWLVRRRGGVSQ